MILVPDDPKYFVALLIGIVFGWLLQRGRVTDFNVIVNQFLFRDFTVMKIMMMAIIVGGVGVYFLVKNGVAFYHVKPAALLAIILGAMIFGVGMVLYGYCPGTALASAASGSIHALFGIFGMIAGAIAYALSFDFVTAHIMPVLNFGKVRIPDITGVNDLVWFGLLAGMAFLLFRRLKQFKL
jgi:uncharacterized membrane protein YedE/YeeE